jgi:hypothetical protein
MGGGGSRSSRTMACLRSTMAASFGGEAEDSRVLQGHSQGGQSGSILHAGVEDGNELRGQGRGWRSAQGRKAVTAI